MKRKPLEMFLFLMAIFLLRFPPLYFTGIQSFFLTTHFLSVGIFVLLAVSTFIENLKREKESIKLKTENVLVLLFFITQSLSIINVVNISIFIQRYSKIIFGLITYYLVLFINKKKPVSSKFVLKVLLYAGIFNSINQLLLLIFPNLFFLIEESVIYNNVLSITKANFTAGKLFDDTYLEVIVPILIFYLFEKKNFFKKTFIFSLIGIVGFLSFASNFRYRLLTFSFSLFLSIFLSKLKEKNILNKIFLMVIYIFIILKFSVPLVNLVFKYTLIDRLISEVEYSEYSSISWRLKMFDKSIEMANSKLLGTGLGNMLEYLSKNKLPSFGVSHQIGLAAIQSGPHNIFFQFLGETGYIGLTVFLILLIKLLINDFKVICKQNNQRNNENKTLISMFWTLIFMVQFFPAINLTFYVLFFLFRGLIKVKEY